MMSDDLILAAKLIYRDAMLMADCPQELKSKEQELQFTGVCMALRHLFTAGTGRQFDTSKQTMRELLSWARNLELPAKYQRSYTTIAGRLT